MDAFLIMNYLGMQKIYLILHLLDETKEALKDIRQTVSDSPRKYIDNTLDVIAKYYNSKS
nr:hypothetical protein [Prevotella sp.]